MTHEDLKRKIARTLCEWKNEPCPGGCICEFRAEACLSAIEQSGCTICDEVSCNRPETVEQSVSPDRPALQTSYKQAASRLYERTKVDWDVSLTNSITEPVCCYVDITPEGFPDMNADLPQVRGFIGVYDANQSILMACQHLLSQIEEPRSGDTDPSP